MSAPLILPGSELKDVGLLTERELKALHAAELRTVDDVLLRVPARYEDRRTSAPLNALAEGSVYSLRVHVYSTAWRFSFKRYFEVAVGEPGDPNGMRVYLRWFNMPYVAKIIATGMELSVYGRVRTYGGRLTIINPEFEILENEDGGLRLAAAALGGMPVPAPAADAEQECIHTGRIVPIYRNISGMAARSYRELVRRLLNALPEKLTPPVYDTAPTYPYREALQNLHFPETEEQHRKARLRFALDECFCQQFRVQWRRRRAQGTAGIITATTDGYLQELTESLPFRLTDAQQRCVREIRADMASPRRMNRLLQGDVGSGKTLVALCAMLLAVESGHTAALLAPTQILAEQHYNNFRRLLAGTDVRLSLRTASRAEDSDLVWESAENNNVPRIIVGTHALLYRKNRPKNLGLAVIDEQHKFGVMQRERFIQSGENPDVLVMTATPIPRTLTLTLYGDLDVSVIDELPRGRGEIITALRSGKQMEKIIAFMRGELKNGRQIYIVAPLIEESESSERASATAELERWQRIFPEENIGLLHGRMNAEEKDAAMAAFRNAETGLLVATTVVEVGVDVPNATVMLINNADSFGLSQLHQLRGRIGRGQHRSYCILLSDAAPGEPGHDKLTVLCRTLNGFEIAEEDFRLRGPGNVLGTEQSGLRGILFPEWLTDSRLIHRANTTAAAVLDADPELTLPEHAALRSLIENEADSAVVG